MGLDMYLTKRHYVKNWNHTPAQERHLVTVMKGADPAPIKPERVREVVEEVICWRKANEIHRWFVDHVQGGKDDCGEYDCGREQLAELLSTCVAVLADHSKAEALLPTQEGFFYGGTEYDEWYFKNLERTRDLLTAALAEEKTGDFYYHSSW